MDRIPSSAPQILSIGTSGESPLWSIMIPVYSCARYIPDVLNSVLVQDLGEDQMQIEVVDDASTDADVEAIVQCIGKGRIRYYRQPVNVGSIRNFETCINRAQGKLVHLLHGDDRVVPGFYTKIASLFEQYPEAGAAFSSYRFINDTGDTSLNYRQEEKEDGILKNWLLRIAEQQRIQYVAIVVRREVYENLGSFYGMSYGEDWEMWVRIARFYPVAYTPEILAEYRGHINSLTWQKAISGKILCDLTLTMKIILEHVPADERDKVYVKAKRHCAGFLIGLAYSVWEGSHNWFHTQTLIKQALSLSKDPITLKRVFKSCMKMIINHKKSTS